MRLDIPPELQERFERLAQDQGISKQKLAILVFTEYFNPKTIEQQTVSNVLDQIKPLSDILQVLEGQLADERQRYQQLSEQHEFLRGEYALVTTKLLPAAEKTMTPWYTRVRQWLVGKKGT